MTRSAILSLLLAACTTTRPSPGCPAGSFPYWLTDGERCVFVGLMHATSLSGSRAEPIRALELIRYDDGKCVEPDTRRIVECPPGTYQTIELPAPSIRFYRLAYVEVAPEHVDLWQADSLYVTSGIVVLNGPRIHSRITAPNTYRDPDGRCYSGNVLHVSGERIAVECP